MRGDVHRLRAAKSARGQKQQGERFAVIVQSDDLVLSTLLVAPTSRSSPERIFRPSINVNGVQTRVLVEQTTSVAPERLGDFVGRLTNDEIAALDEALRLVLQLD